MGQRPKRRKYKDNPYTLEEVKDNKYIVSFKDGIGSLKIIEVSKEVYDLMDRFELDDLSELNEYDNHIEHSEIYEESLYNRAMEKSNSIEDIIIQKSTFEDLRKAINQLSNIQKRRIKMYYFENFTLHEIAKIEHCHFTTVKESIESGIKKLKKILK